MTGTSSSAADSSAPETSESATLTSGFLRITVDGDPTPFPVAVEGVDGTVLLVRRLEEGEAPPKVTVPPGVTQMVLVTPVRFVSVALTAEVGRKDDLLTWVRVVERRREGTQVYGRTLRSDESDTGQAILLRPGDQLTFEPGDITISLKSIDEVESQGHDGYAPVTGVLWTWMTMAPPRIDHGHRYLLAAARRLDSAQRQIAQVVGLLRAEPPDIGPRLRGQLWEIVASVEVAVIAYGRAFDMARRLEDLTGVSAPFPSSLVAQEAAIHALRNAYEHIEDRALGQVRGKPDPAAVSIFDWKPLFERETVVYAGHEASLDDLLAGAVDLRRFLISAAIDLTEGVAQPSAEGPYTTKGRLL